ASLVRGTPPALGGSALAAEGGPDAPPASRRRAARIARARRPGAGPPCYDPARGPPPRRQGRAGRRVRGAPGRRAVPLGRDLAPHRLPLLGPRLCGVPLDRPDAAALDVGPDGARSAGRLPRAAAG